MPGAAPPTMQISVRGCYAAELGGCDGKLSLEHWISASVLRLLTVDELVPIRGLPWQRGDVRSLPIATLPARILCAGHNSQLSKLDDAGLRWAKSIGLDNAVGPAVPDVVDGHRFERWLLKMLCGLGASGNAGRSGAALRCWSPPTQWLRVLFGHDVFPPGVGLYTVATRPRDIGPFLAATPFGTLDALAGMIVHVPNYALLLSCHPPSPALVQGAVYRPNTMDRVGFIWNSRDRGEAWSQWSLNTFGAGAMAPSDTDGARRPRRRRQQPSR